MPKPRQIRERTCIGCGSVMGKDALMRIVRTSDGAVCFDGTGRLAGRGAYVCSLECLEKALRAKKVHRALKANVAQDDIERILAACGEAASKTSNDRR